MPSTKKTSPSLLVLKSRNRRSPKNKFKDDTYLLVDADTSQTKSIFQGTSVGNTGLEGQENPEGQRIIIPSRKNAYSPPPPTSRVSRKRKRVPTKPKRSKLRPRKAQEVPRTEDGKRIFFRSTTLQPFTMDNVPSDSEAETDPEWFIKTREGLMDEFLDINEGEKELMKLWNKFMDKNRRRFAGDLHMSGACEQFALENREIVIRNLYRNFCLHLANLVDNDIMSPEEMNKVIEFVTDMRNEKFDSSPRYCSVI